MPAGFEATLEAVEGALDLEFRVTVKADLKANIGALTHLSQFGKSELEAFLSRGAIISLTNEDFERLQARIRGLVEANRDACDVRAKI